MRARGRGTPLRTDAGVARSTRGAVGLLAAALFGAGVAWVACGETPEEELAAAPAPEPEEPRSAKGLLRVSVYGPAPSAGSRQPQIHQTVYVRDRTYAGMEDNDLRGFLDGHFKFGWNQVHQAIVRVGRRHSRSRFGEYELFRVLQLWDDIRLPPAARVHRARLELTAAGGPRKPLELLLYEVKREWRPGSGGVDGNDHSIPASGEVWWNEAARGVESWGLPGASYASDDDPDADIGSMPLAEARWQPEQEQVVFESLALASYVERQVRAQRPVRLLIKLANPYEDRLRTVLTLISGNADGDRNPVRRPRLVLDWESPAEVSGWERPIHLEYDRSLDFTPLEIPAGGQVAMTFLPAPRYEPALLEARPDGSNEAWRNASRPFAAPAERIAIRARALHDPLTRGSRFRETLGDTRFAIGEPENQHARWTFVSPSGRVHRLESAYTGDYRWEVDFQPNEFGRWTYVAEHDFDPHHPSRSPVGVFDVVAGDRRAIRRQLRGLAARIKADGETTSIDARIARYGEEFLTLERAAMQLETAESFRARSDRKTIRLLNNVRVELGQHRVPERQNLRRWRPEVTDADEQARPASEATAIDAAAPEPNGAHGASAR